MVSEPWRKEGMRVGRWTSRMSPTKPTAFVLSRFRRVTSSGLYLPEIDALRFIAIALVVVGHVSAYVEYALQQLGHSPRPAIAMLMVSQFGNGVQLVFVISGFILSVPFAAAALSGTVHRPSVRSYYLRRVTRLEPPYVIIMCASAAALVFVRGQNFAETSKHLLASLLYCHALTYGRKSTILIVAWSLEIEAQYYVLAPLLSQVYRIPQARDRRALLVGSALAFVLSQEILSGRIDAALERRLQLSLVFQVQYFLVGMLLADYFVANGNTFGRQDRVWDVVSLVGWPFLFV